MKQTVTTFSFAGDLEIAWVIGLAIGLSLLSWWLYRLETKKETSHAKSHPASMELGYLEITVFVSLSQ